MCHQLTYLSYHSQRYYVAVCEHGTVHFTWQRVNIHAHLEEFQAMALFLQEAQLVMEPGKYHACKCHAVAMDGNGRYQVWLWGIGLYVNPAQFEHLINLVSDALVASTTGTSTLPTDVDALHMEQPADILSRIYLN